MAIAVELTIGGFSSPFAILFAWLAVSALLLGLYEESGPLFPIGLAGLGIVAVVEILQGLAPIFAAPAVGVALFASAEFGYWSLELRSGVCQERSALLRRFAAIVTQLVVAISLAGVLAALDLLR